MSYDDYPGTYEEPDPRIRSFRVWLRKQRTAFRARWVSRWTRLRRWWRFFPVAPLPRKFADPQPELAALLYKGHARGHMVIRFDKAGYAYEDKKTLPTPDTIVIHQENQPPIPVFGKLTQTHPGTWVGKAENTNYLLLSEKQILLEETAAVLEYLKKKQEAGQPLADWEIKRQEALLRLQQRYG